MCGSSSSRPADAVCETLPVSAPVIAVGSGKGGVGKTSVAIGLARELVRRGRRVGLLDADLTGPDVPRMLGIRRDVKATSVTVTAVAGGPNAVLETVAVDGLEVASVGFLLGGNQGLTMAGPFSSLMLGRLLHQTAWGDIEVLVVDLPPGSGDVQQSLLGLTPALAAVLVVTPSEVAHLDTGRTVAVLRQARVELLGAVENMAFATCPHCGEPVPLHPEAPEERTIWALGVPRLARLPYRPDAVLAGEELGPAVDAAEAWLAETER